MKTAHLILTHKNPRQLERLLDALEHPDFHFFIHIDKKADIQPFLYLAEKPRVQFIKKRTKIYWAAWGTIQATINGFEEILPGGYDYVNVISGQDFLIKPAAALHRHLLDGRGKEYITCHSIDVEWMGVGSRVWEYHLINWRIPGRHRLEKLITRLLPRRKFPLPHKFVGRANWFTLSAEAIAFCLDFLKQHPEVIRYYKYCWGADEFIFSTILYNSHFKPRLRDNLVYVDWSGMDHGHPKILSSADFEQLKSVSHFFARKFDMDKDEKIFSLLEEYIAKKAASN